MAGGSAKVSHLFRVTSLNTLLRAVPAARLFAGLLETRTGRALVKKGSSSLIPQSCGTLQSDSNQPYFRAYRNEKLRSVDIFRGKRPTVRSLSGRHFNTMVQPLPKPPFAVGETSPDDHNPVRLLSNRGTMPTSTGPQMITTRRVCLGLDTKPEPVRARGHDDILSPLHRLTVAD
jgi:hypothetical protein